MMDTNAKNVRTKEQDEILALARNTEHYCDLLIEKCDNWLPEEEGLKNLRESNKKKKLRNNRLFPLMLALFAITFCSLKGMNHEPVNDSPENTNLIKPQDDMAERLLKMEQEVASGTLSDEEMFANYRLLIIQYSTRDFEKSKLYFQKGIDFARAIKREEWEAQLYGIMSNNYLGREEKDTFLIYTDKVFELIEGKEHYLLESQVYGALGDFYQEQNQLEKAMNEYFKSLEVIEKDKKNKLALNQDITAHNLLQSNTIANIATLYYDMRNLEKAVENLLRAKQILDENPHESNLLYETIILENLAQFYMEMGQMDKVLPLALQAYEMAHELERPEYIVFAARLLSDYYRSEKDLPKALRYAKEALQIAEQTQLTTHLNWADMAMMETSRAMKDYQAALFHAGRMAERTDEEDWDTLQTLYKGLIMIYSSMNNPAKTEEYLNKLSEITTKISDENLHNALQEMEVKYDVQQKNFEIERQQAVIDRQTVIRNFSFMGLAVALLIIALLGYIVRLRTRRNRELAETNAIKDKFFSIISHDLKNPAISQRDAIQTLLDNTGRWETETLRKYYQDLLSSADHQVDLLYNLLNWAHVQTGRMPFMPFLFDLSARLRTDLALLQYMADVKNIRLDVNLPQHALVRGDSDMLTTVVRNLVTNAVKFTGKGGQITLTVAPSAVAPSADSGTVAEAMKYTVTVTDTGVGMSSEQLQKLFHIDRTQSLTGTTGKQRIGLGMVVCREFLEKHGSRLQIESTEGQGSKFWFDV
jgi:signal transduction histidine kinase